MRSALPGGLLAAALLLPAAPRAAETATVAGSEATAIAAALRPAASLAALVAPRAAALEAPATPARWTPSTVVRPARSAFPLEVGGRTVQLRVMAIPILPGDSVRIERTDAAGGSLTAAARGGALLPAGESAWTWVAPEEPGLHPVRVVSAETRDTIDLTFMVAHPAEHVHEGSLHGYAIGRYRPRPASMTASYEPPEGFVEVRAEDLDVLVSPNFRLGQFLCKQEGERRFVVISPNLVLQLEDLLEAVNDAGYPARGLTVMSGFRTPAYNRAIGNTTDFSRHLWGDAADVYVDDDGNGSMDDLDRNGRADTGDARWLASVAEKMMADTGSPTGGLSVYSPTAAHGPFVHVDARGALSRW